MTKEVLPLGTKFTLGPTITDEQKLFLDKWGYLHFEQVATQEEVSTLLSEMKRIEAMFYEQKTKKVNGVPVFYGRQVDGSPLAQRLPFTSTFSEFIRNFVRDSRFEPIRLLFDPDARVGDEEKDGVVMNQYINIPGSIYRKLGWHNDALRDVFYGRVPDRMLNVGIHLDDITEQDGGLRLIPGTQNIGLLKMAFGKAHFVSHGKHKNEITVETKAGDLTVHDGRMWHRVAQSQNRGNPSFRRTMFVPYVTGPYEPKDENSKTAGYHHLGAFTRFMRNSVPRRKRPIGSLDSVYSGS